MRFLLAAGLLAAAILNGGVATASEPTYERPSIWSGLYGGGHLGYSWSTLKAGTADEDLDGIVGGGQIGYNWQHGNLVFGLEGDLEGSGQDKSFSVHGVRT